MQFSRMASFKSKYGTMNFVCAKTTSGLEHSILWVGEVGTGTLPLLRIQSSCVTSTALGGIICDCSQQLDKSFESIADSGSGAVIYLQQEGRGHGLFQKIETMHEMNKGLDTVDAFVSRGLDADIRNYDDVFPILEHINFSRKVRLITNNPAKVDACEHKGFKVAERVAIVVTERAEIVGYMSAKKYKMGHLLGS